MNLKCKKLPCLIIVIGLIVAVLAYLFTAIVVKPTVTEYDFNYSITYKLNGETVTFEDVYKCRFVGMGRDGDPTLRYYEGTYLNGEENSNYGTYTLVQKDGLELRIVTLFTNDYLMGDGDEFFLNDIYLAAYDSMGVEYTDAETLGKFDAQIVSYELPEPIENSFVFGGFSLLHDESMIAMLAVGILVVLAAVIFVKRDESVEYKLLDKISIALNIISGVLVVPFVFIVMMWAQIFMSTGSIMYQIGMCVPAFGMFTVAISLCLRRKGYTMSGFFVQIASLLIMILFMFV